MAYVLDLIAGHRKLVVALIGAGILIIGALYGETSTVYTTAVSLATALGVYATPNSP